MQKVLRTSKKGEVKLKSSNVFSNRIKYPSCSGLPGKSYLWILSIDYYIYSVLSMLSKFPAFDVYITTQLKKFYRIQDREKQTELYLNFLMTTGVDRIYFIYPSRIFSRQKCMAFFAKMYQDILLYRKLTSYLSKGKELSKEECIFYTNFSQNWSSDEKLFQAIEDAHLKIQEIMEILYSNLKSLVIKLLLCNRRGDPNPDHLRTDAYAVILSMVDQFLLKTEDDDINTKKGKGKVPFTTQLRWLSKNKKNLLIQEENWNLGPESHLVSLDNKNDEESSDEERATYNWIVASVEQKLREEKAPKNTHARILEVSMEYLPKPFKELVTVAFNILTPLPKEREIQLAINSSIIRSKYENN